MRWGPRPPSGASPTLNPRSADGFNNLGFALQEQGRLDEAIEACAKAIALKPDHADAYNNMGNALRKQGRLDQAAKAYGTALKLKPEHAGAHYNLGSIFQEQGSRDEAIAAYRAALAVKPDFVEALNNLGTALKEQGRLNEAIEAYAKALAITPGDAEIQSNLGAALKEQGKLDKAIEAYARALSLKPDDARVLTNLGVVLREQGKLDEAIEAYRKALSLDPGHAEAYNNLGVAFQDQGKPHAAIAAYGKALALKPDHAAARAQRLHQQALICDWSAIEDDRAVLTDLGIAGNPVPPFVLLSLEDEPERHRLRAERFAREKLRPRPHPQPQRPAREPGRIRIGYFSSDFREHPVAVLLAKVIENHDREKFEVVGYSLGLPRHDEMRKRLSRAFCTFRDVHDASDEQILGIVRDDRIDIAVDLTGYTYDSRSGLFAYRLAPVQINYLGYPGTMGAEFMDYIVADRNLIPEAARRHYSEKPIYLPHQYQPQDDGLEISAEVQTRADLGLPDSGLVFCAMNNSYKITPREFDIWMRLLRNTEGSVLWLLDRNGWAKANLLEEAAARGVAPERLVFAGSVPHADYLARFRHADLYLDTFNYNAGATASNALWAGLPVVTRRGEGYTARMASSLLMAVGLPELIVESEEAYEALCHDLALSPGKLAQIRSKLEANRRSTPLFDTLTYTRHLEHGYRLAHARSVDGLPPETIDVPA